MSSKGQGCTEDECNSQYPRPDRKFKVISHALQSSDSGQREGQAQESSSQETDTRGKRHRLNVESGGYYARERLNIDLK